MTDFKLDGARPAKVSITRQTMEDIVSLLEVGLREGEFESDYEYQKTQEILEECRQSLSSPQSQEMVWHPFPETPLPETEFALPYLVTAVSVNGDKTPFVRVAYGNRSFSAYKKSFDVIAWAELPPLRGGNTMTDWHKWPDEKPERQGSYLITVCVDVGVPYVIMASFNPGTDPHPWGLFVEDTKISAWAELPSPYHP